MNSKNDKGFDEKDVILLEDGLVGLPRLRRWMLVDMDPPMPLKWLQSVDRPGFRVPVADPVYYDPGFAFELDDRAEDRLGAPAASDVVVMIVSTIHPGGERITGNLTAPIVVNVRNRKGLQCILDERNYCLHQEIDYVRFGLDLAAGEAVTGEAAPTGAEGSAGTPAVGGEHAAGEADVLVRT